LAAATTPAQLDLAVYMPTAVVMVVLAEQVAATSSPATVSPLTNPA
jgi:hypothetical protein